MSADSPDEPRLDAATSVTEAPGMMRFEAWIEKESDAVVDDSGQMEDVADAPAA